MFQQERKMEENGGNGGDGGKWGEMGGKGGEMGGNGKLLQVRHGKCVTMFQ